MLEQVGQASLGDHSEGEVGKPTKAPAWLKIGKDAALNAVKKS